MKFAYPLKLRFKLIALSSRITVSDAQGQEVLYVHQKAFKLREDVRIYANSQKEQELFAIKTESFLDISAEYAMTDAKTERKLGSIKRDGLKSIWKASYLIKDAQGHEVFQIKEKNVWVKIGNSIMEQVPILALFSGYFFHPEYEVIDLKTQQPVMTLKKESAFFESAFSLHAVDSKLDIEDEHRVILGLMMLVQLERQRG
jgi:uncharacterized protein YxjI